MAGKLATKSRVEFRTGAAGKSDVCTLAGQAFVGLLGDPDGQELPVSFGFSPSFD